MTGDLTVRGVTRPVVLDVEFEGVIQDPWGNQRLGFSASGEIDRNEFGVSFNAALETGGFVVGRRRSSSRSRPRQFARPDPA